MWPTLSLCKIPKYFIHSFLFLFFFSFFLKFSPNPFKFAKWWVQPILPSLLCLLPPIFSLIFSPFFLLFLPFFLICEATICHHSNVAGVHLPTHRLPTTIEDSRWVAAPPNVLRWWIVNHSGLRPSRAFLRRSRPPLRLMWAFLESSFQAFSTNTHFARWKLSENWHMFPSNQNFASGSEPNRALFWRNNFEFILVIKKLFPMVYNLPMFEVIRKKSHIFWYKLWNW